MYVFYNREWDESENVVVYGYYHKYWTVYKQEKNPKFDIYSGKILDLKEGNELAINYFYNLLNQELCKNITVCVVPSHDNNPNSGIIKLGKLLAQDGRIDKVHYLQRMQEIDKLANGGERGLKIHLDSIETDSDTEITGDVVLLMDDVTTSNNSLKACKKILLDHGAEHVAMFALGQTIE